MKKRFIVEIEVDEKNIAKKYPNYNLNWDSPQDFIKSTINHIKFEGNTDMSKYGLNKWGYSIKIKEMIK